MSYASLTETLRIINQYAGGDTDFKTLKEHMAGYGLLELNTNFHTITICDSINPSLNPNYMEIINTLKKILEKLSIPSKEWDRYLKSNFTIYEFLAQLKKDNYLEVGPILRLIDKKIAAHNKKIGIVGILILATLTINLYFNPLLSSVLGIVQGILSSAIALPIIGLIFTSTVALYQIYSNHFDQKRSLFNRIRDNAFLFTGMAINISAYIIWIVAATSVLPILPAGLFFCGSMVNVFKELFAAVQNYIEYKTNPTVVETDDPLASKKELLRRQERYISHRNAAIVDLIAAVVLTGIMTAWSFAPGGIFLTIGAILGIAVLYTVQKYALKFIESTSRDRLQTNLKELTRSDDLTNCAPKASGYSTERQYLAKQIPFFKTPTAKTICQTPNAFRRSIRYTVPLPQKDNDPKDKGLSM